MRFTSDEIAQVCHEANRGLQRLLGEQVNFPWESTGPELRGSAISGVEKILSGETAEPGDSHAGWLAYKAAEGWTYGPVKDFVKKEHPQMVPFEELPAEQQLKDQLFFTIVKSMAAVD